MSQTIDGLKEAEKETMNTETHSVDCGRHKGNVTGGLILISIGTYFLLSQLNIIHLHNWWALFILIPAFHTLREAWDSYQANGRLNSQARGSLTGGILLSMLAAFFLFNLSWGLFWPFALIFAGVAALLNNRS